MTQASRCEIPGGATSDGGRTWRYQGKQALPKTDTSNFRVLPGGALGFLSSSVEMSGVKSALKVSNDQGMTFADAALPGPAVIEIDRVPGGYVAMGLDSSQASQYWAAGDTGAWAPFPLPTS